MAKLSSGNNLAAIFNLGRGAIEVDCATKATNGYDNIRVYKCSTMGTKQVCLPVVGGGASVEVKVYDSLPTKAAKVCGPANAFYR